MLQSRRVCEALDVSSFNPNQRMASDSADNPSRRGVPQLVPTGEQKGKPSILLNRPVYQIGARESCRILLVSSTVSQVHALLVQTRHTSYIRDLASRTGVLINGKKVREAALTEGDLLKIGRFEFIYRGAKKVFGHEPSALPSTLEVTGSPIPVPIEQRVVLIGRRRVVDIPLLEESVSNAHAVIFEWEGKRFIRDLGSRTGTFLNGKKIHETELSPDDVIRVGDTKIRYTPSTQVASVDVIDSATDSQIAAAPSAEEVEIDLGPVTTGASRGESQNFVNFADTIGDLDLLDDPSHHDTAMIPLSLEKADHGLDLIPEKTSPDEPMPRSWREASTNDLPPLEVEEAGEHQNITVESVAREEATDLGLTSHLDELSPASAPFEPLQLLRADEAPVREGSATIDLSNVNFDASVTHTQEIEPDINEPELPLIAHDDNEIAPPAADTTDAAISLDDTLAAEASPLADEPSALTDELPPAPVETVDAEERIEVIEPTEPTPESALNIPVATADESLLVSEPDPLSDTNFSRQVEDFTEASTGDIVEPPIAPAEIAGVEIPTEVAAPIELAAEEIAPVETSPSETSPSETSPSETSPSEAVSGDTEPENIAPMEIPGKETSPVEIADALPAPAQTPPEPILDLDFSASAPPAETVEPAESNASLESASVDFVPEGSPNEPTIQLENLQSDADALALNALTEPPSMEPADAPITIPPTEPVLNLDQIEPEPQFVDLEPANEPAAIEEPVTDASSSPFVEPPATAEVVHPQPSLDDLALEALSSDDSPLMNDLSAEQAESPAASNIEVNLDESAADAVIEATAFAENESHTPAHPVFGSAIPDPVETHSELHIPEESVQQEGSATISSPPDATDDSTTVTEPVELSGEDLISPPILPLDPQLHEIDIGLEPLPDAPAAEADASTRAETETSPPLSSSDSGIAASLTGGVSNASSRVSLTDLGTSDVINDPFDMPSLQIPVPPRPLKKRRDRGKQTVIRNFGKDGTDAETSPPAESPFAGAKAGEEPAIEFETPEGSVDVFGVTSPDDANQLLSSLEQKLRGIEKPEAPRTRGRRRGKDSISPRAMPLEGQGKRPPVAYSDMVLSSADAEARRKKLIRRMVPVALVGLLLAVGAWFAAWHFVPVVYDIQASVKFDNLNASDFNTQRIFRDSQLGTLRTEATRRGAILTLKDRFPQVEPGFLADPDSYLKAVNKAMWSNQQAGLLQLEYAGLDRSDDTARMLAVTLAIYRANGDLVLRSRDANRNFNDINKIISRTENQVAELTDRIEKDRLAIDRYQPEKLTAANVQLQNLDKAYQDAFAALKGAQAELQRLKKTSPVAPATQAADGSPSPDDLELATIAKKAEDLSAKLNSARAERAELAKQARESLDSAYQQFQKQIEASQGAMQQSPELARFVDTAQAQLKTIRELTEDFIASQQREYQQLAEAKAKLDEKMQSRRADLWAKDEQLQELAGQREITIRKINAAKSDNLDKDAESLATELNLIESSIKGRQDVLATDSLYADVINTLQQLIDSKQKELLENRKKTDDKLNSLQKQFAASLPTVEKLPQEQQALAAEMKQRLGEIDSARRQYAAAADQASVENDVVIKNMSQQLASLQGDMEIRKQQILAAQNGVAVKQLTDQIAQKEKEVADLTIAKDQAEQSFFATQALVRELQTARSEAETAMNDRYEAQQQKSLLEQQLEQAKRDVVTKKKSVDEAITPIEPTLADVLVLRESDRRQIAAISASGGMVLLTLLSVLWLAFAAAHANPFPHHTAEAERNEEEPHENEPAVV